LPMAIPQTVHSDQKLTASTRLIVRLTVSRFCNDSRLGSPFLACEK
jgi:hypothetical protein